MTDSEFHVLAVVLARAGSKGLPSKNVLPIAGRPMIHYTLEAARAARRIDSICVTTDLAPAAAVAREFGVYVVDRPPELATDNATVDAAVRHAVETYEQFRRPVTHVVILYGNVPVRAPGIIDRAVEHLLTTACDSVRSVHPVDKQHPDWLHRLEGDRLIQFRRNSIYRRQELEPLYYHDGAVLAVTRATLFVTSPDDPHAFLGRDRRAVVSIGGPTVDVDSPEDLQWAEAIMNSRGSVRRNLVGRCSDILAPDPSFTLGDTAPTERPVRTTPHGAVAIANRTIGGNSPVFVIAEAGVNHGGSFDTALRLIDAAREAGADAVKFQCFSADALVAADAPTCDYQTLHDSGAVDQRDMLRRLELSRDAFQRLAGHARDIGLPFLVTPFGTEELRFAVETLRIPAVKVASTDIINMPLLTAARDACVPVIVSTGAADAMEVDAAVQLFAPGDGLRRLILLHCVSAYPTPRVEARLRCIQTLSARHDVPVGFSDHTEDVQAGADAVLAGACVLEKHLTLDRTRNGPDHFFSLEPSAFAEYVRRVRDTERMMGDGQLVPSPSESQIRQRARGRIIAKRIIRNGECLQPDMLIIQRASVGLSAAEWGVVIGRRVCKDVPESAPLTWDML